jgi:RNA polymerase sigma factor (sigma-70 family)
MPRETWTEAERATVGEMYLAGASHADIGRAVGRSWEATRALVHRMQRAGRLGKRFAGYRTVTPELDAERQGWVGQWSGLVLRIMGERSAVVRRLGREEAYSAGMEALVLAASRYDPADARGASFSTYAYTCIWRRLTFQLFDRTHTWNGRTRRWQPRKLILGYGLGTHDGDTYDVPCEDGGPRAVEAREELAKLLGRLPGRYCYVVTEVRLKGRTEDDVAAELGTTRQNVNLIINKAMVKLRSLAGVAA